MNFETQSIPIPESKIFRKDFGDKIKGFWERVSEGALFKIVEEKREEARKLLDSKNFEIEARRELDRIINDSVDQEEKLKIKRLVELLESKMFN